MPKNRAEPRTLANRETNQHTTSAHRTHTEPTPRRPQPPNCACARATRHKTSPAHDRVAHTTTEPRSGTAARIRNRVPAIPAPPHNIPATSRLGLITVASRDKKQIRAATTRAAINMNDRHTPSIRDPHRATAKPNRSRPPWPEPNASAPNPDAHNPSTNATAKTTNANTNANEATATNEDTEAHTNKHEPTGTTKSKQATSDAHYAAYSSHPERNGTSTTCQEATATEAPHTPTATPQTEDAEDAPHRPCDQLSTCGKLTRQPTQPPPGATESPATPDRR